MRQARVIGRVVDRVTICVIGAGALAVLASVYAFSQSRFFTIDEYQYGHATWLVARGQVPYRDFFEHHFPLSYLLHAPFLWEALGGGEAFANQALLLRKLVFATLAGAAAVSAWAAWRITGSAAVGAMTLALPPAFGFSLMSAVDYRADCFGAFYLVAALALLEWNRAQRRAAIGVACGVLLFLAAGMTQKVAFAAGTALAAMLTYDALSRRLASGSDREPLVARPLCVIAGGAVPTLALLGAGAAVGVLADGFAATVTLAARHEELYQPFSVFGQGYVTPFLARTWPTTIPVLAFAAVFLATREGRFWLLPLGAALLGAALLVAPYPYNFVLPCWLLALAAVRGFHWSLQRVAERASSLHPCLPAVIPLAWLAVPAACFQQLAFVGDTTSNDHQLEILSRIERFGEPSDAVIDNAGGAMFSPHASYYFYNGDAHRKLFDDYFRTRLVDDYRASGALFWIKDLRSDGMPDAVTRYLESHYVSGGGNLHTLGFLTPAADRTGRVFEIDVVRPGHYHLNLGAERIRRGRPFDLRIDGQPATRSPVFLSAGTHEVSILPESPPYVISLVPGEFFDFEPAPHPYSMMFEYRGPARGMLPVPRTGSRARPAN